MKNHEDLARGWWRKGNSDLENARLCVVEARYDEEFWPELNTAREAVRLAEDIGAFILTRLPPAFRQSLAAKV